MPWLSRPAGAGALLCALTLIGCGEDAQREPSRGGTLTMLTSTDVDFLDPGHTAFAQGMQVAAATQRRLFTYRPGDQQHVVPDLASSAPAVSHDGRTVTVHLRRGVRFSPPVRREVTSHDVEYALERFFSVNVGGGYTSYYSDLVGAPSALTDGVRRIRGISTPDAHTIVFRLKHATSATFVGALTMPASAPVPPEYAKPFDAQNPSTYNRHVVATGPYMVRLDREGNTVGYRPGTLIELVRNPSWDRRTDWRPAYLDAIRIRTNATDANVAARQVLTGHAMVYGSSPPPSVLRSLSRTPEDAQQVVHVETGSYRYLPINTTIAPFDRVDVRRAVLAAFDRAAARQARGGPSTGPLATHFLPPGVPGFEEAGGLRGPGLDFLRADRPRGDLAVAQEYMRRAGFPSGRYTGKEDFLVVAGNTPGERNSGSVAKAQFEKLGFHIRLRVVPDDALFTNWCSVPAKQVVSCSGIAWLRDFSDPEPMLKPAFDGDAISDTVGNYNFPQLDDPAINAAMDRASTLTGKARLTAWAAIDRQILDAAAAVPLQWDATSLIESEDVDGVASETFGSWDFALTRLR